MPPQRLHLSWKDHNGDLVVVFENLWKRNSLVDCTLAAEGQYLKAHKVVLAACSSYFEDLRGKSPTLKSPQVAVPPKSHSRKDVSLNQRENIGETSIILDNDKNSIKSSSHQQMPHRDSSGFFPVPSSLPMASSFSIASASASILARAETHHNGEFLENSQCLSPSVSAFPPGDSVPPDVNTVIKTEPATDMYIREKSDENERDFEDVTVTEDQEDWDDPNIESVGDDLVTITCDPDATWEHGSGEEPHFTSILKEQRPGVDPGPGPAPGLAPGVNPGTSSAPSRQDAAWQRGSAGSGEGPHFANVFFKEQRLGPAPGSSPTPSSDSAPATSSSSSLHGGARTGAAGRGTATLAPRAGRFQCSLCDYATNYSSNSARHQFVHTGEKLYKCTVCSYATSRVGHLKLHADT